MVEGAPARILVAEDVEASRVALEMELADAGFAVESCAGGDAALQLLSNGTFDALVTDLWMPEGDGIALLRRLEDAPGRPLVYAVTGGGPGMPTAAAASLARIWNASRVFLKPFDIAELVAALREDLAARG